MHEQNATALEANNQILAASFDAGDSLALELRRHLGRFVGTDEPRVVDSDALEAPPDEDGFECAPNALDLRQLRHG